MPETGLHMTSRVVVCIRILSPPWIAPMIRPNHTGNGSVVSSGLSRVATGCEYRLPPEMSCVTPFRAFRFCRKRKKLGIGSINPLIAPSGQVFDQARVKAQGIEVLP